MEIKTILVGLVIGVILGAGVGYTALSPQIETLQNQINGLQTLVNNLKTEADKVPSLQIQITSLTNEKNTLQTQLTNAQAQVINLQAQLDNLRKHAIVINASTPRWVATELTFVSGYSDTPMLSSGSQSTFEDTSIPDGWSAFGGTLSISSTVVHSGSKSICLSGRKYAWESPAFNIYNILKRGGGGTYGISFWVYVDTLSPSPQDAAILVRGSAADENSFIKKNGDNYFGTLKYSMSTPEKTWVRFSATITVLESDLSRATGTANIVLDIQVVDGQKIYFDDFTINKKSLSSPFNDAQMDVTFTSENKTKIIMPAFWDGGNTWKVRFAPTLTGIWTFSTTYSDPTDTGLHNKTGYINCIVYTGNLDIYNHGFITISDNKRYFTYADGTPFFYLGDTHWSMPFENIDASNVVGVPSQLKDIVDKRVAQGFTVYQSEPLIAKYDLSDGVSEDDIPAFEHMDKIFKYIADKGLVHANAQLFFTNELGYNISKYPDAYLEKLCRYWVARYSAYPVLWTTAQEADTGKYFIDVNNNTWKKVAAWVHQYDPYGHPLTAHMDDATASTSSFKYVDGHNWYAAQWNPSKTSQLDFEVAKDFWSSDVVKPTVNYEGQYDHFWTNTFGARMQGWTAYLNGMYGHGYGAAGIWMIINNYATGDLAGDYDLNRDTDAEITKEVKRMSWYEAMQLPAANQLGYMRSFLQDNEWWLLTPRFDDVNWFINDSSFYSLASKDNTLYVAYFYNPTLKTGTLKGLDNALYTATWYNPVTGVYLSPVTLSITNGAYAIGNKPDNNDWVLVVKKA